MIITKETELKKNEEGLKFSKIIDETNNNIILNRSISNINKDDDLTLFLEVSDDQDLPERTLTRIKECQIENEEDYFEDLYYFISSKLKKNKIFQIDIDRMLIKVRQIITLIYKNKNDFPYIVKNCKHIYLPELSEEVIWELNFLFDIHSKFYKRKRNLKRKFLDLKDLNTFSKIISSEIDSQFLKYLNSETELLILKEYIEYLNVCNEIMLNKKINENSELNSFTKKIIYKEQDFMHHIEKFKKSCILPYHQICKNFENLHFGKNFYNYVLDKNEISAKTSFKINNVEKTFDNTEKFKYSNNKDSTSDSFFNQFFIQFQKTTKDINLEDIKQNFNNLLSLDLIYYPSFKKIIFKALYEIAHVKFFPTKKGNYDLNIFNPYFKLREVSGLSVKDFDDETYLAALYEQNEKGNIDINYSFKIEDFSRIKENLINSINYSCVDQNLNDFRSKLIENLIDILISKEFKELREYFKEKLKNKAQKFLMKKAISNFSNLLNLNYKKNLFSINISEENNTNLNFNGDPISEELLPKTLSLIYSKNFEQLDIVVLNQFGEVQYDTKISQVKLNIIEYEENIDYILEDKTIQELIQLIKLQDPHIIVIGSEDIFSIFFKNKVYEIVLKLFSEKLIKNNPCILYQDLKIQNISINTPIIKEHLKKFSSENTKKAICLGRFIQFPLNEISLLWDNNPDSNHCLKLPLHKIIHLANKELLQIFLQIELVKAVNKKGIEINKAITLPHYYGSLQFISSLGIKMAERIRDSIKDSKIKGLYSREELFNFEKLKKFPGVIKECKEFFKIKKSMRNNQIFPKNSFECLNISNENFYILKKVLEISPLYNVKKSITENLQTIFINKSKDENINISMIESIFPGVFDEKCINDDGNIYNNSNSIVKYKILNVFEEIHNYNKFHLNGFENISYSYCLSNQVNYNLVLAKLVVAKVIKIDFENEIIHCRLFNDLKATLYFEDILQGINENFKSNFLKKLKIGDYITSRIYNIDDNLFEIKLFIPTKNFIEIILKPSNSSANLKHNLNPFWRFFDEQNYQTGINLKFPINFDFTYSYNANEFYIKEPIKSLNSADLFENKIFLEFLTSQTCLFFIVTFQTAKDMLINFDYENLTILNQKSNEMPFIFFPSFEHPKNELFICLKTFNNRFWKIKIEIKKKNENMGDIYNHNYLFKIENEIFENFDEIIKNYLLKLINFHFAFKSYRKFTFFINKEHIKSFIENKSKLSKHQQYYYTIFSEYPEYVILCLYLSNKFIMEFIKITTSGFIYHDKIFDSVEKISSEMKSFYMNCDDLNIEEKIKLSKELEYSLKKRQQEDGDLLNQEVNMDIDMKNSNSLSFSVKMNEENQIINNFRNNEDGYKQENNLNLDTIIGLKRERTERTKKEMLLKTRDLIPDLINEIETKSSKEISSKESNDFQEIMKTEFEKIEINTKNKDIITTTYKNISSKEGMEIDSIDNFESINQDKGEIYNTFEVNKSVQIPNNIILLNSLENHIKNFNNLNSFKKNDKSQSITSGTISNNNEQKTIFSGNPVSFENSTKQAFSLDDCRDKQINNSNSEPYKESKKEWGLYEGENNINKNLKIDYENKRNEAKFDEWGNYLKEEDSVKDINKIEKVSKRNSNDYENFEYNINLRNESIKNINENSSSTEFKNDRSNNRRFRGEKVNRGRGNNTRWQLERENNYNKNPRYNDGHYRDIYKNEKKQERNNDYSWNQEFGNNQEENKCNLNISKDDKKCEGTWGNNESFNLKFDVENKTDLAWNYNDKNSEKNFKNEIKDFGWGIENSTNQNSNLDSSSNFNNCWNSNFSSNDINDSNNHQKRFKFPNITKNFENNSRSKKCYNFGEEGHHVRDCPNPKKHADLRSKICFSCGEEGHFGRDCSNPNKEKRKNFKNNYNNSTQNINFNNNLKKSQGCFNCGEEGHFGKNCPNPKKEKSDFKKPNGCFICGQICHRKYNCPEYLENKQNRGKLNSYFDNEKYAKIDNYVKKNNNFKSEISNYENTDWSQTNFIEKDNYKNANLKNNDEEWNFTSNNNNFNESAINESKWGEESNSENQQNCENKSGWI